MVNNFLSSYFQSNIKIRSPSLSSSASLSDTEEKATNNNENNVLRTFLKSPNHIAKIDIFQRFKKSYVRKSCENGISEFKTMAKLEKEFSLKSFSLEKINLIAQNLETEFDKAERIISKIKYSNRKLISNPDLKVFIFI